MRCMTPVVLKTGVIVPCGKCYNCIMNKRSHLFFRAKAELLNVPSSCFITLTYAESPVSLVRRDVQLFIKRLRKLLAPRTIRIFGCGEYGPTRNRPHYHLICFGLSAKEVYELDVASVWSLGFLSVSDVSDARLHYISSYSVLTPDDRNFYNSHNEIVKPFQIFPTRPGLGACYLSEDVKAYLSSSVRSSVSSFGLRCGIPRYYIKQLDPDTRDNYAISSEMRIKTFPAGSRDFNSYTSRCLLNKLKKKPKQIQ